MSQFCPHYERVAWSHQPDNVCLFTRLRCKRWSCEFCARKNQSVWRAFLLGQLPIVSDNWWMLTLTAHSRMRAQEASYKNLSHGIDKIMKRVRRVWVDTEYVRVYEKHPTSEALHAHLEISGLTPFVVMTRYGKTRECFPEANRTERKGFWTVLTWFKTVAQECKIGYQVEVEPVQSDRAAWYVTKYLTKDLQGINIKGLRHVQTSHRVGSPSPESVDNWEVGNLLTAMDVAPSERVLDLQSGETLPPGAMSALGIYPPETERATRTG